MHVSSYHTIIQKLINLRPKKKAVNKYIIEKNNTAEKRTINAHCTFFNIDFTYDHLVLLVEVVLELLFAVSVFIFIAVVEDGLLSVVVETFGG